MKLSGIETLSSKKWLMIILIHAFGYTLVYGFSVTPIFFSYTGEYTPQNLRNYAYFFVCYMLVQYVLLQILVGGKWCGRRCHLRMCLLDAGISAISVILILIMPAEENWMKPFCIAYHAIGLGSVLLSTAITLIRTRHLSAPTCQDPAANTQYDALNTFDFVKPEVADRDSAE